VIVLKFGGTSVGDAAAIDRAASIVRERLPRQPVVVVSAMAGTTNALLSIADDAARGQLIGALRGIEALRDRHLEACDELLGDRPAGNDVAADLSAMFDELASLAEAFSVLGHVTPRSLDAIAAVGEELSSHLVVAAFCARGVPADLLDARDVIITDDAFQAALPRTDLIAVTARERVLPRIRAGRVPVLGGFIGATADRITTTLGRGGSDFSASLIGAALQAEAIEIWTDVDGMLTGDPRIIPGAQHIESIRFDEASELAAYGAKVLHPNTIAPAVRIGIPVYIFNSLRPPPAGRGTRITFEAPRRPVSAIAGKTGATVVKVRSPRMLLTHGFLQTVFEIFARHRTSVDVVATSEVSVSVTVDDPARLDALTVDLARLGDVSVERNRGVVAVVGAGMSDHSTAMARAVGALGEIRVHMLSLSASGINLTMVVDGDAVPETMRRLHAEFFGSEAADAATAGAPR
jgi:aspartate kinase